MLRLAMALTALLFLGACEQMGMGSAASDANDTLDAPTDGFDNENVTE